MSVLAGGIAAAMLVGALLLACALLWAGGPVDTGPGGRHVPAVHLMIGATLLGLPYVQRRLGRIGRDTARALSGRGVGASARLGATAALAALMVWLSAETWWLAYSRGWRSDSVGGAWLWIPYLAMPVGFALYGLQLTADLYARLRAWIAPAGTGPKGVRKSALPRATAREKGRMPVPAGAGAPDPFTSMAGFSAAPVLLGSAAVLLVAFDGMRGVELMPQVFFAALDDPALLWVPLVILAGAAARCARPLGLRAPLTALALSSSLALVACGSATETPIGRLMLAAVGPGVLAIVLLAMVNVVSGRRDRPHGSAVVRASRGPEPQSRPGRAGRLLPAALCTCVAAFFLIAAAAVFSYALSSLQFTDRLLQGLGALGPAPVVPMFAAGLLLLAAGSLLPPVAASVVFAPVLMPMAVAAGFDPAWFAVSLVMVMHIGVLLSPTPMNPFVTNRIAPVTRLRLILRGAVPAACCLAAALALSCFFPSIATAIPDWIMGPAL